MSEEVVSWWWVRWTENGLNRYALFDDHDVALRWQNDCKAWTPYVQRYAARLADVAEQLVKLSA